MFKKKNLMAASLFALTLMILLIGAVNAKPTDPTEGDMSNVGSTSVSGCSVSSGTWGYWVWFWMYRPPYVIFTREQFNASRIAGPGCSFIGLLSLTFGWEGGTNQTFYGDGTFLQTQIYYARTHHAYCQASSKFLLPNGDIITLTSPWTPIDM